MDPVEESRMRRWAGRSMRDAVPREATADLAEQLEVTPRHTRRSKDGKHPSWVTDTMDKMRAVHEAGGDIWRLVKHFEAYAKYLTVQQMPTAGLVERHHDLVDVEHDHQARQDRAIQNGACPTEEGRALQAHAAILSELDAVKMRLQVLNVDPRDFDRRAD